MIDTMRKIALTGLGLAFLTKDKLEELSKELIDKAKLSEQEGRELVDELKQKSEQAKQDVEEQLETMMDKAIRKLKLATRDDLARLEKQVEELAAAIKETRTGS